MRARKRKWEEDHSLVGSKSASQVTTRATNLCELCRSMTSTKEGLWAIVKGGYVHCNVTELECSARYGCSLCRMIYDRLQQTTMRTNKSIYIFGTFEETSCRAALPPGNNFHAGHPFAGKALTGIEIFSTTGNEVLHFKASTPSDKAGSPYIWFEDVITDVSGPKAIQHAKSWLEECQTSHEKCPGKTAPSLPARVIDVGSEEDFSKPKLHISKGKERALYAALSHRWGNDYAENESLTNGNWSLWTQCLPLTKLSQTMNDAIITTRFLGLRYLWVDTLCILQDSEEDKAAQITAMGNIYKNATIMIAAARAGASTGFLGPARPVESCQLPFYISDRVQSSITFSHYPIEDSIYRSPLHSRGWTLQEFILSSRVLSYDDRGLFWSCRTKSAPHAPIFIDPLVVDLPIRVSGTSQFRRMNIAKEQTEVWQLIVREYSGRNLKYYEDRLPGMAGIAKELKIVWDDEYLAGMWRKTLIYQLGWYLKNPGKNLSDPYRAPSWSWASSEGEVRYIAIGEPDALVIGATVKPKFKEAPMGKVENGRLTLLAAAFNYQSLLKRLSKRGFCVISYMDREGEVGAGRLWYLLLGYEPDGEGECWAVALILTDVGCKKFKRIGMMKVKCMEDLWLKGKRSKRFITIV